MRRYLCRGLAAMIATLAGLSAQARVTRVVVEDQTSPAFEGRSFGAAGPYQRLSGHVFGELDPKDPRNALITDIALAPRDDRGMVEYSATFSLIAPVDPGKSSGVLTYLVPNRGGVLFGVPDGSGSVILTSGWQGDIPPRPGLQTISVPVARNADGSPVTGVALATFANMPTGQQSLPINGGLGAGTPRPEPASLDKAGAHLTQRLPGGEPVAIAPADWAFADCRTVPFPGTPDPHRLCLKDGFDPAYFYELAYVAKDPPVLGIGFAATRDINDFFRYAAHDDAGFANPVAGRIHHAIAIGFSQSGNFLRSFVNLGFNQSDGDKPGRMVWDGIESNIAGRQLVLNIRFAAPGGAAGIDEPGSDGVLWWGRYDDAARGRGAGSLLDRCTASKTCPKVFELFGATEFWGLRMSPDLVGTDAKADIPLPANVRRYYFPGTTHGGGKGGFALEPEAPPQSTTGDCTLPGNPNPSSDTTRALTAALIDWVAKGTEPPASRYPTLRAGQLVPATAAAMGFPAIPGAPKPDGKLNPLFDYDFGPDFDYPDLSGVISVQPPVIKRVLPSLVPKTNADGNETVGVASVLLQVPLGTYLGWNETAGGFYKGEGCGFAGGFIPFARTKAERLAAGDPRLSLQERYGTHEAYVARVRTAAERLAADRMLLPDDRDRIVRQAEESRVLR